MALLVRPISPIGLRGVVEEPGPGPGPDPPGFNPLSIDWHTAFWAEDPNWTDPGDGNAVSQWDDATGGTNHATQATGSFQPTFQTSGIGGQPSLLFDSTDRLTTPSVAGLTQPVEYFAVIQLDDETGNRFVQDGLAVGGRHALFARFNEDDVWQISNLLTGGTPDLNAHAVRMVYNSTSSALVIDGSSVISGDAGTDDPDGWAIGGNDIAGGTTGLDGYMAFWGAHDGLLTAQERSDLLAWAQSDYGTP